MDRFDLMSSDHFVVVLHPDKKHGLIFNRLDDSVTTINYDDAKELCNLKQTSQIYGIVGLFLNKFLVVIKNRSLVGRLFDPNTRTEHEVYVITQVQVVDVSCVTNSDSTKSSQTNTVRYDASLPQDSTGEHENRADTDLGPDDEDFSSLPITISTASYNSSRSAPWNPFKLAANTLKPRIPAQLMRPIGSDTSGSSNQGGKSSQTNGNHIDDSDKRLIEEMIKLFNNTNSFYYSPELDLTNRFSHKVIVDRESTANEATWRTADERFFWNKHMLKDLIELSVESSDANLFICVILQGFISIESHTVYINSHNSQSEIESGIPATSVNQLTILSSSDSNNLCDRNSYGLEDANQVDRLTTRTYQLALISRRSVFHAGTRYRRRGCDENGHCANFVETEQIFRYKQHLTSIVMIRGSIPLFWYQTGFNYRPPPVLYKSEEANHAAFSNHFEGLIKTYETDHIISIDCTEHTGREKSLHDAFKNHMEVLRSGFPNLKLIEFDFHKHCRGRQSSDLQVIRHLKSCGVTDQLMKDVRYYWNDGDVVLDQTGLFRVNCVDCTDRTNIVQRAIALQVLDLQLARLGVIAPDTCPEDNEYRRIMQAMWSTNGNVLSTQYCGTRALFTDKKLSGYLKDTYSSASRYYMSKFRDVYRQAAIDAMLGVESSEPDLDPSIEQTQQQSSSRNHMTPMDHFEFLSLEPVMSAKAGGALLKDVGSRVSNRLARLKGTLNVKPSRLENDEASRGEVEISAPGVPGVTDTRLSQDLDGLNIDWPSSESVANNENRPISTSRSTFDQLSTSDDNFQDDELGQLMLSIDLAELQRLRDTDEHGPLDGRANDEETREEIDLRETRAYEALGKQKSGKSQVKTSTTST